MKTSFPLSSVGTMIPTLKIFSSEIERRLYEKNQSDDSLPYLVVVQIKLIALHLNDQ